MTARLGAIDGDKGSLVTKRALRLAPFVFVRPGKLRQAEWTEFDLDGSEWRIPAERMQMRARHIVPLSKQAVAILRELHPLTDRGKYVFPGAQHRSRPMCENTINGALNPRGALIADKPAFIPRSNRIEALKLLRDELTEDRYLTWLLSMKPYPYLEAEMGGIPSNFEKLYLVKGVVR